MASTTFVDRVTTATAEWLNEVNTLVHTILGNPTTSQEVIDALPVSTTSTAGTHSAADKTKLDGIETAATADQDASEVVVTPTVGGDATVQAALTTHETRLDGIDADVSTGSEVFSSVSSESTGEVTTIAIGLSTDDYDFGFSVLGATNQNVRVGMRTFGGYSLTMNEEIGGFSENAQVASMTAPLTTAATIKVYNAHTAAQNITVRWWARKR